MQVISRQATINVGTIGHVAHGKSTVVRVRLVCEGWDASSSLYVFLQSKNSRAPNSKRKFGRFRTCGAPDPNPSTIRNNDLINAWRAGDGSHTRHLVCPPLFYLPDLETESSDLKALLRPAAQALSGVYTIRFKQEKERNITIKLGYANTKVRAGCAIAQCYPNLN